MTDPLEAFQTAQAALLNSSSALTALATIFDPMSGCSVDYDMVEIGDDHVVGEKNTCFEPSLIYSTVHIWCNPGTDSDGRMRAKAIGGLVRDLLGEVFALSGHQMTHAKFESGRYVLETDPTDEGLVCHGILVFTYRTIPNPA